ncbi:MAG TPA: riboflavin synthase [Mycobacteriales bacterium]|nr:riboflavin synthase [Mycobacteriales bacterium]
MFTGIVEELGELLTVEAFGDGSRLAVRAPLVSSDLALGDSVSVNGVCLTAIDITDGVFRADVMAETLRRSSLSGLEPGAALNLERAAKLDSRLGGHLVQGHVDGMATLSARVSGEAWDALWFRVPQHLARYVVEKGSIALDGVSLTVIAVTDSAQHSAGPPPAGQDGDDVAVVEVGIIPTTLRLTTLGRLREGERVNVEVDVIAKYVERLLGDRA